MIFRLQHPRAVQVRHQVGVVGHARAHATPHPDQPGKRPGIERAVLERMPARLEEQPLLGIHQRRFALADPEERGVEHLGLRHHPACRHVVRVGEIRLGHAGGAQFLGREDGDALGAGRDVAPERRRRIGARKPPGHADDGDTPGRQGRIRAHDGYASLPGRRTGRARLSRCRRPRSCAEARGAGVALPDWLRNAASDCRVG